MRQPAIRHAQKEACKRRAPRITFHSNRDDSLGLMVAARRAGSQPENT